MSRIEFGGHEGPIPDIAIPDPNLSSDLPIQSLELIDGVPFEKADWVALGYTHYEVWCIGGAGGRGADVMSGINWLRNTHTEVAPSYIWDAVVASYEQGARNSGVTSYSGFVPAGTPQPPVGVIQWIPMAGGGIQYQVTPTGLAWLQNPDHTFTIWEYHDPYILGAGAVAGGGGGGGGLHVVSGALADLPDSVPVEVGAAGVDAAPGQIIVNGPWDPTPAPTPAYPTIDWATRYTRPSPILFPVPQGGGDGGASSFGAIGEASGGKGGDPAIVWVGGNKMFRANGGQGGKGGQTAAGGGGLGSVSSTANGQDGGWDGTVGSGGGGGRGGMAGIEQSGILHGV